MSKGNTLVEVLVAILICMIVFTAAVKLSALSLRSGRTSENLTFATVYAHTKLASLVNMPPASADLQPGWHHDLGNPIKKNGVMFYRFWQVDAIGDRRRVVLGIAWNEGEQKGAGDFSSIGALQESRCMKISFSDVVICE